MANTATKKASSPCRLTYEIAGDGTATGLIANATILADMDAGPLKDIWNATYANQAAMRTALLYGEYGLIRTQLRTAVADTTAEVNQPAVDVDTDAQTATKAEINYQMSDTTGTTVILTIEYVHSLVQ